MTDSNIRPLDISTDLEQIASLLYTCFSDTMDTDGEKYIAYLKRFSKNSFLTNIAKKNPDRYSLPGEGFVYEKDGKIIGNITLSAIKFKKKSVYLISNVAVEPNEQRKGIAKELTETALRYIECLGITESWLQVKDNNEKAINLYSNYGFETFSERTTWVGEKTYSLMERRDYSSFRKRRNKEWPQHKLLFQNLHPDEITSSYGFVLEDLKPGIKNISKELIKNRVRYHWVCEMGSARGFLHFDMMPYQPFNTIWLAVPDQDEEKLIQQMIPFSQNRTGNNVRFNYPAGQAEAAFLNCGMKVMNTLLWMKKVLT